MKPFFSCFLSVAFFGLANSQPPVVIKHSFAFFKEIIPGYFPDDRNGHPVPEIKRDTLHLVYLETTGNQQPILDSIWYKGQLCSGGVYPLSRGNEVVGIQKRSGRKLSLKATAGCRLWRLELTPTSTSSFRKSGFPLIRIKGKIGNRSFVETIKSEIEIESDTRG